jgi:hypothetical protein
MNYHNRVFRGRSNSPNGEVSGETRFHYRQDGDRLWGEYSGGSIRQGHLLGKVHPDGSLEFLYHHVNASDELMAGRCTSTPGRDESGRLVLKENWQWLTGDQSSGQSEVEEVINDRPSIDRE